MIVKLLVAGLLAAHGLIHAGFVAGRPAATADGPAWPFELARSWVLTPLGVPGDAIRIVGVGLVIAAIVAFALAGLVVAGILPAALWPALAMTGAAASLAVLLVFFHPWLILGVAIDLVVIWSVIGAGWRPESL
jgi:hypothetical protein